MIILNQNSSVTFAVTIFDDIKDMVTGGSYTLSVTNTTTLETYSGITLTDLTGNTERYDLFEITLTGKTSIDYSNAIIYLPHKGLYDYYIYYNNVLCERGILRVEADAQIETHSYAKVNSYHSYKKI